MVEVNSLRSCFFYYSVVLSIFLGMSSCVSVEMVYVKNSTSRPIQFRGHFVYKPNSPFDMDFLLNPGADDSWRYEQGYFEEKTLDKGLKKIILKNDQKCQVILSRKKIEKMATKNGMWEIDIVNETMNCR